MLRSLTVIFSSSRFSREPVVPMILLFNAHQYQSKTSVDE